MDLSVLKKKISSYRTPSGRITKLPDELLGEILHAWEQWTGPASGFYKELGADHRKMGALMGRAKKLKRDGVFDGLDFKEIEVESDNNVEIVSTTTDKIPIELVWDNKRVIRFNSTDYLLDFLKKAA
jgi:hypothetical protein